MTNPTLADVLWATNRTPGWLAAAERTALFAAATEAKGPIIEIGTYCGLSTCYLAGGAGPNGRVYAIDPHDVATFNPTQHAMMGSHDTRAYAEELWTKLGLADRITVVQKRSLDALDDVPEVASVVFIDGDHRPEPFEADLRAYAPRVEVGGWLLLHDWGTPGDEAVKWDVAGIAKRVLPTIGAWPHCVVQGSLAMIRREA